MPPYNSFIPQRFALVFLAAILCFAVYNAGGPYTGYDVCLLGTGLLAAAYLLLTRKEPEAGAGWLLLFPGYVALQLLPLPLFLLRLLSPTRARILESLGRLTPPAGFAPLSTDPALTIISLARIIGYVLFFFVARDATRRLAGRKRWIMALPPIAIAAAEAALGLLQNARGEAVEGTYVNKNHFAGLLEMALPLTAAYALALFARRSNAKAAGMLSLALLTIAGLVCSVSKMGFAAGLTGLFAMGALAIAGRVHGGRKWLAIAGLAALALFGFVFLPSDAFIANYGGLTTTSEAALEGRGPIWRETLRLIAAYPAFGVGLGNYETAFLRYQAQVVDRVFTYAHNDYLQIAAELGLIGLAIAAVLLLPVFSRAFRAALQAPDRTTRYLGLGCAGAITAICLHSVADFNMYVPANAFLLAWICGMAASLPQGTETAAVDGHHAWIRKLAIGLAGILIVYAPVRMVFDSQFRSDSHAESEFCRFGICDTDAVITAQKLADGGAAAPVAELLKALRRDPNSPSRWADTGEAMLRAGRYGDAQYCMSQALALGPHIPPLLMQAADFYSKTHQMGRAMEQMWRVLADTDTYDGLIFAWFAERQVPVSEVLAHGLPPTPRAAAAYMRSLIEMERPGGKEVWAWISAHGFADARLAREYVEYLTARHDYESAASAWALYLGPHRNGYLESNWVFNGDFESEFTDTPFDWRIDQQDDVEVSRDAQVAHSGTHSLRITFAGKENVDYGHFSQTAFVKPGRYRFEAWMRTDRLTTNQGVGFRILDPAAPSLLDVQTERMTGSADWKRVEEVFEVSPKTRLIRIQVVRRPSEKFDNQISGTVWIDTVSLTPMIARK